MKTLLLGIISVIAISCGGSSGGNGGDGNPDNCLSKSAGACMDDRVTRGRKITKEQAIEILKNNKANFINIIPGQSFNAYTDCYIKEGSLTSGSSTKKFDVKTFMESNNAQTLGSVEMLATVVKKAEDGSCASEYFNFDKYLNKRKLANIDTYLKLVKKFDKFEIGKAGSSDAIEMFKREEHPGYWTERTVTIKLDKNILVALSTSSEGGVGQTVYASLRKFYVTNKDVDPSTIITNGLDVVYSDDNEIDHFQTRTEQTFGATLNLQF